MELEDVGRTPIPGGPPAGQDARYEPEFEQLQAEIDKISSVTAGGVVDWNRVVDLAGQVLSAKAKDLTAAAYLAVGLTQTRGAEGLTLGSRILGDLVAGFWEDCFPARKRLRGRMAAFAWWQEKTLAWLRNYSDTAPVPAELHAALTANVQALDKELGELMPDFPPMRELTEAVGRLPVAAAGPQTPPPAPEQAPQPAPGPRPDPAPAASPAEPAQDAKTARDRLAEAALAFASLAGAQDPADPWPFRAVRLAAWIRLWGLPPAEGGRTMIPPPEPAQKAALQALLAEGRLLDAVRAAEEQVTASLFWLDPHRIAAKALEGLGPAFAAALAAVRAEVRLFLARLPGVEQLAFADGTPVADAETRAWLASLAGGAPAGTPPPRAAGSEDDLVAEAAAEAQKRFAAKDEAGALDVLGLAARRAADGPSRLRLTLAQMDLLGRAGRWPVAASLAEAAVGEVERRGLEDWDPDLAVEALLAARAAHAGLGGEAATARAAELLSRVARIRPAAALHLPG